MTGTNQRNQIRWQLRRGERIIPEHRFEQMTSTRVRCALCHAYGMGLANPTVESISPWQIPHVQEHLAPCKCGLVFLSPGHLNQHIKPGRYPWRSLDHAPVKGTP